MARADFNPLDFGDIVPEDVYTSDVDLSQYLPAELPPARAAHRARGPAVTTAAKNLPAEARALLDTIATDESPDYNTIYGGRKFSDYSRHPGAYVPIQKGPHAGEKSSAAGRYQFIERTWNDQAAKLGLKDFSPESQDLAAWNYAQEVYGRQSGRDLLSDLRSNDPQVVSGITNALSKVWTSMPGGIEQRSHANKFLTRYTQSLAAQGATPAEAQGPQGETYDIPLSNGQTLTVPKGVDRQEAINGLRAQGMDVEGIVDYPLTSGQTLTLPESVRINDALADLQKQFPDQEWMTKEHAEKTGFGRVVGTAVKGVGAQFERGLGELIKSPELAARGKAWQEELAGQVEEPLPTDPLSTKLKYYGGTALGGLAPLGAAVAAAPLLPEAAVIGGLGAATIPIATGSLAQRYDEQGKPFDPYALKNIGAVGAEAALQTLPLGPLGPVAGQFGKSAIRGALGAAAADVPSVAIERAAAGQPLADEKALEEYGGAILADVVGGGALGAAGAFRGRPKVAETPELPPVQEGAAPSPVEPAPTGGEALAPTQGPAETVEDLEAQARAGEEFFRQAEAEIPEPTIRGEEQAMPPVEEAPVEAAPLSFADLGLKGKNSKVLMRALGDYDIENPEHGKVISDILDNAENVQHDPEVMQAIRTRLQEVQDASKIQGAEQIDAGRGERPQGGEEIGYPTEGGEGVRVSDQEGQGLAGESEGFKKVGELGAGIGESLRRDLWKGYSEDGSMRIDPIVQAAQKIAEYRKAPFDEAEFGRFAEEFGSADTPEIKAEVANRFATKPEARKFAKAEEPAHIDVDGIKRPVTDSTGQRIHTTEEGVKNFWKNFKDSKAVDAEGRPVVIYRGSSGGSEAALEGKSREGYASFGSSSPHVAASYAGPSMGEAPAQNAIAPYYINAKKLIEFPVKDGRFDKFAFDRRAKNLAPGEVLVARKSYDMGPRANMAIDPQRLYSYSSDIYAWGPGTAVKSATGNKGEFDTTKADIREARGVAPEAAHTPESLDQQIKQTYGKNTPRVDVSTAAAEGVEPNVKGFYDPAKKRVVLIADNIGKNEDVHGLLRHEVAVHAKRLGKTDPEFKAILDRLQSLKGSGDASVARAYDRVPKDTTPAHVHEEALAYLAQHAPNLPIVKQFTSWLRRTAHKLTGSADWLKADDFGPMADAILKRAEPVAPKAEGRMYSVGDAANDAVKNTVTETWFERFYTPIRTKVVSVRAPLEVLLGKLPLYDENNEIRATAKIAQQTRHAHLVSEALHTGFLAKNKQGLIEAVFDPRFSPDQIINRVMELPEAVRDRFSDSMVTLAQAGHNLRGAEMKAVMNEAQRKIKLGQAYLDQTKARYEKTKATLDTLKSLSKEVRNTPRMQKEMEKAQSEFDAAKAEYRNPNYAAGKDYIAMQQRLYRAVQDQFTKARRDEAGRIYDISPEQERAAREFLNSTPETRQLAADIRGLFAKNAKLLRDTSVISDATYKKFTDAKYDYAPLYMSIEDLDAAMPASAVYLQGGQRSTMPIKGLKGGQHQVQFFENLLSHQARTGAMALHNNARLGALESLVEMGRAKELPGTTPPSKGLDVVAAIKDGKRRYYHVPDRPLYEAFEIVHNVGAPQWLTDTTKFASRTMLVNPKYWWNQLVREPFMATFTSRAGIITPFHSGKEFASLLFSELPGVDTSAAKLYRDLKAQGVSGSHEYLRDLIKEKGKLEASKGLAKNYKDSRDLVMRIHEYADAATKVAVMRKARERAESGELTGRPLQGEAARDAAITHVGEMINFANRGRNSTVKFITQTTPFFNSWAQGMDALIRYATGYGMDPHAKGSTIAGLRTTFIGHAAAMAAFSFAITAIRCELSEDYRNADPEDVAANWLIPIPETFETKKGRMIKAKGPFELNTLFKLGPELWVRNWYGLDRDKDYTSTLKSSIWRDIAPPGLDQLFMPYLPILVLESLYGYEFSEGGIKPLPGESLAPAERGKGASPIADTLSGGPLSPAAVKHFGQGYFGGMYDMLDSTAKGAAAAFGSDTARADLRDITEKVPVISGMLTNPDVIQQKAAYEFADKKAMARHTAKVLTRRGEKEEAAEYKEEARYAKQAEKIKRKLSKTNTAIERLKNTRDYEDADKLQREYEDLLNRKRKQVGQMEALRTKSEEKE